MAANKWTKPEAPPPPLFLGEKERDLVKQVNDEVIERVIGQAVLYLPLSVEYSNYHPLYGEAIEKTFLPPVRVYALVQFEGLGTTTENYGLDKDYSITVNFHERRLYEDQNLYIREGDYLMYGESFFEIVKLVETKELFGQADARFTLTATCIRTRRGLIDLSVLPTTVHQALIDNAAKAAAGSGEAAAAAPAAPAAPSGIGASIVYTPPGESRESGEGETPAPAGATTEEIEAGESININGDFDGFFGDTNPTITPNTILIFQNGILQSIGSDDEDSTDFYIDDDYNIISNYDIPRGDRITIIALEAIVATFGS